TGPSGKVFQMIQYNIEAYPYRQRELESDGSDKGLYMTLDDDGKSYYYRGNVNNNYVKFAGFYWRIIRLNGDGSVRLLYAGESPISSGINQSIESQLKQYNFQKDHPAYVGYMYGNNLDTYENVTKNEKDSTIKMVLDNWYQRNIVEKGYHDKIADSIFCNDRELQSGTGDNELSWVTYKAHIRSQEKNPTLMCHQQNDRFTTGIEKGNGSLTYPVGLITSDELMYAGIASGFLNRLNYTFSNQSYWTMSPSVYNSDSAAAQMQLMSNGTLNFWVRVIDQNGVRVVLNIKGDSRISGGIGTAGNPFVII
ncbi:MAG: hypothetical protein HFH86_04885, partial [Bacilli bacterium]|nr:hypothetical protein [Bacilli bacterium]